MSEVYAIAPFDFHIHTALSHDGSDTIKEYCDLAKSRNMKAIGFCEHVDLDPRNYVFGQHDYDQYRAEIEAARARFGDALLIRMGAEVGYVPRIESEIADYLNTHQYDFVAGAVHEIDDGASGVSEEFEAAETFARFEPMEAYHEYFETIDKMVVTGLFDVISHLDLINRYGAGYLKEPLSWGRFYGVLRRILEGAIKRQMAVEINTSGLRQAPQATYPPAEVLQLYKEIGGALVIIGSDAHSPDQLCAGVPAALKIARQLGLNPHTSFKDRIPERIVD